MIDSIKLLAVVHVFVNTHGAYTVFKSSFLKLSHAGVQLLQLLATIFVTLLRIIILNLLVVCEVRYTAAPCSCFGENYVRININIMNRKILFSQTEWICSAIKVRNPPCR